MSRGQKGRRGHTPREPLATRLPGGCPDCTAYRTVHGQLGDVLSIRVHHDATCPRLAEMERAR